MFILIYFEWRDTENQLNFCFFGSYRVNSLQHCRLCAFSVAITFPFTLIVVIIVLVTATYTQVCLNRNAHDLNTAESEEGWDVQCLTLKAIFLKR